MIHETGSTAARELRTHSLAADFAIAGGGLAGVCAAITAARAGLKVVLVQDRPVLGGNASSEVRLWILGATSHMGNNNRWAREGGVVDEILVENLYRNPEGNPVILDALLLEKVRAEANITLLLNTTIGELEKGSPSTIASITGYCSQNQTRYRIQAPLFCDASGDGILGFLAGAAFRMGAEAREEFGEGFAPADAYGELLGHSLYFYTKDAGRPVRYVPPAFALRDIAKIPRYRDIQSSDSGCRFWWLEWGGRMDTIHDTEEIKWELWKVAYGVWDYIKNSGRFPEARNLTLEWIGSIPGKRESRRFEGDYILRQQDIVGQRRHDDAVSFGGWAIDLHPADGVYSELSPCTQWHAKGVYQIPYRCLYSRNVDNLFLAGRLISVSHVAFGSTRVMATCGHNAQAAGMAAAMCAEGRLQPRDLLDPDRLKTLQRRLLRAGQYIPGVALDDPEDLAREAEV
ncbi:MAG: FAD-dependent oxidoreductase, partial [Acidobacteriota bacterium]|nr:FAD-dependent oxidoreductase [Acidobacteriota bacterium]